MKRTSEWIVNSGDPQPPRDVRSTPVMAWARDIATGVPVYVLELDKSQTGGKCGCACPSCGLPLIAVNAAKAQYFKRPHFRHPNGAEKAACMYLSARLAALYLLREQGVLLLPRRKMSAHFVGLSGFEHQAWVEQPAERVRISNFDFRDKVSAVLTLEDGRQLRVQLMGTGSDPTAVGIDGYSLPTILLDVNDLAVASMSPEELRNRITLVPDNLCWLSHWNDQVLQDQALEEARRHADDLMDLAPTDPSVLEGVEPKFRRETMLHFEVKRILSESKEITVPALEVSVCKTAFTGKKVERHWGRPSELIPLFNVQLEQRFGRVIPDVITNVAVEHGDIMMIEVTVTNQINDERLARIQEKNIPTLEINLALSGGRISRSDLEKWVVHGLEVKRWLHHPDIQLQTGILLKEVEAGVAALDKAAQEVHLKQEQVLAVLATPLEEIAQDYLKAVFTFAQFDREVVLDDAMRQAIAQAKSCVGEAANKLAIHGYAEAADQQLAGGRKAIVPRLLSIQGGKGVGYRLDSTMEVMNAIRQASARSSSNHTIYLIAEKAYRPQGAPVLPEWYTNWVDGIKLSIESGETTYVRDGMFDRLLALLFPDIAMGLATRYGTRFGKNKKPDGSELNALSTTKAVRDFYNDGAYRPHAPRIVFDDVLREAAAINRGDTFRKWFQIWSDRYTLKYDLLPIAQYLQAAGFDRAMEHCYSWNTSLQEMEISAHRSMQIIRDEAVGFREGVMLQQPKRVEAQKPAVNLYALAKGRDMPRN